MRGATIRRAGSRWLLAVAIAMAALAFTAIHASGAHAAARGMDLGLYDGEFNVLDPATRTTIEMVLNRVHPDDAALVRQVDELDSREELNYIHEILNSGTGADRQLRVFRETGDLKKVVDYIIEETEVGLAETEAQAPVRKVG